MKRDLHIVVCVLNEIKSHVVAGDASLASLQPLIYVPVHCDARDTLKMAPLAECSYGDDEWLKQGSVLFFSPVADLGRVRGVRPHPPWRPSEKFMVYQFRKQ